MWIATHFRSFLKLYINNSQHSTQLSSLIIPAKHHLNANECFLLPFCFYVHIGLFQLALRAIWNNLSKKQFSNNAQHRHAWELQNRKSCAATAPTYFWLAFCNLERLCFPGDAYTLTSIGKHIEKPSSMKHLWTTLADRRRAGPPAFRRKCRHKHNATLSFSLGGRLFLREFWQSRRG